VDEPDFFLDQRVAILGLGLMGGSLALALRGRCRELTGVDPDQQALELARQRQIVDWATSDAAAALPGTGLVVLAAPVRANLRLAKALPELHPGEAVVLDLGSTKREICQVFAGLPARFDPIGGHPMCGKEHPGLVYAEAEIFKGAVFAFTPLDRTSQRARELAQRLAQALGSHPLWLDAATHDRWVASSSHLPYLLANALALTVPEEAAPLIGPGYNSTTRLAASFAPMMLDVLLSNRQNVLSAVGALRAQLDALQAALEAEDALRLRRLLEASADKRRALTQAHIGRETL